MRYSLYLFHIAKMYQLVQKNPDHFITTTIENYRCKNAKRYTEDTFTLGWLGSPWAIWPWLLVCCRWI